MQNRSHMQGYLLKRNKEHRKANLLGVKYKRRWVELTADTLVYASSQQELLTGNIQVYAIEDMLWVRAEAKAKFLVKFQERTFTFKVETGSSTDRDSWVAALKLCKQQQLEDHSLEHETADKLDHLRKVAEQQLLDPESPNSSTSGSIQAFRSLSPAPRAAEVNIKGLSSGHGGHAAAASLPPAPVAVSYRTTETGSRPLSPRSLLASAKAGSAFVGSNSDTGSCFTSCGQHYSQSHGSATGQLLSSSLHQDASSGASSSTESSCSEDDEVLKPHAAATGARAGSLNLAPHSNNAVRINKPATPRMAQEEELDSDTSSQLSVSPPAAASTSLIPDRSRASSGQAKDKRAMLTRRLTPGVMLINTTPSSSSPSASCQLDLAANSSSRLLSDPHAGSADVLTLETVQPTNSPRVVSRPGSHVQAVAVASSIRHAGASDSPRYRQELHAAAAGACDSDEDLCDEILRLDPSEVLSSSGQCSAHASELAARYTNSSRMVSSSIAGSRRPGSAPHCTDRPHSPLKSCLRTGGNAAGSLSTPSSNSSVAAAAAAAVAMTLAGSSSAKSKLCAAGVLGSSDIGQQKVSSGQHWIQQNWDGTSDDEDDLTLLQCNVPHSDAAPAASQQRGHLSPAQCLAASADVVDGVVGVRGTTLGVKADAAWLDDDFDS